MNPRTPVALLLSFWKFMPRSSQAVRPRCVGSVLADSRRSVNCSSEGLMVSAYVSSSAGQVW
eukprot:12157453-Alexandrium_andersonii.AAC.1